MKKTLSKTFHIIFFSLLVLLGMSCATITDRHPDSTKNDQQTRWANPLDNPTLERVQSR